MDSSESWAKRISDDYATAINLIPIEYIRTMECKKAITDYIESMTYSDDFNENENETDNVHNVILAVHDFDKRVQLCIVISEMGFTSLLKCIPSDIMCNDKFINALCNVLTINIVGLVFIPREHHTFRLYSIAFQSKNKLCYYYDDLMYEYITTTLDAATNNYFPKEINKIISALLFHRTAEDIENLIDSDPDASEFFQ